MKAYYRMLALTLLLLAAMFAAVNLLLPRSTELRTDGEYRVEISRLCRSIEAGGEPDLSGCRYVTSVQAYDGADSSFYAMRGNYAVQEAGGKLYRFDYHPKAGNSRIRLIVNLVLLAVSVLLIGILLYVRKLILKPFSRMTALPAELAKGNLTAPLHENRSRYFGKFVWGVNMLRETLEKNKERETSLLKEQQTLVLSVSHDIKTPLSAIRLYAKALEKGLYPEEEKRRDAARHIDENVIQIEHYISQLTQSAAEDFIQIEVQNGEFYLSELTENLRAVYAEKFAAQKIPFTIESYSDCLLYGDADRAVEVLQNLLENALKYGAGGQTSVRFSDEEDCRLVTVANSGCTLPESEAVHMFDSFWRGSNAEGKSGSGLGLYICKRLMQAMNGEIFSEIADGEMRVTAVFRRA